MYREKVFVLLAPGFEERDATTITCTLRRSGLPVTLVGLMAGPVRGANGLSLLPDSTLSQAEKSQPLAVVLPGGLQGSKHLNSDPRVHALLRHVARKGGYVAALDTAYTVLRRAGLLDDPALGSLSCAEEGLLSSRRVVVEGPTIFGRDSGAAQETALTLVAALQPQLAV
jgi:4-methyl-5(b-hydroxyethyl)-thiazole monophosphate biosynthesis